jgi:hypothetical protein
MTKEGNSSRFLCRVFLTLSIFSAKICNNNDGDYRLLQLSLFSDTFETYASRTCQLLAVQELGVRNRDVCIDLIDISSSSQMDTPKGKKRSSRYFIIFNLLFCYLDLFEQFLQVNISSSSVFFMTP